MANICSKKQTKSVLILSLLFLLSCNPVGFRGKQDQSAVTPDSVPTTTTVTITTGSTSTTVPPAMTQIQCQVRLNGNQTAVTLPSAGPNPTVSANCNPASVNYSWTVTRGGGAVAVPGLTGASSTPDFVSVGPGTYSIVLTATATNYLPYTSTPVTVVINQPPAPVPNVNCTPRINGNQTAVTLAANVTQAQFDANCQPVDASCAWTVMLGTQAYVIPGLSSCSSNADFANATPGTYSISLTATRPNHNTYVSPSPLTVTVPAKTTRDVSTSKTVTIQDNQLDVTLIIDDSNSMLADNQKLGQRLQGFVSDLTNAGFDWQMCVTVTHAQQLTASDPTLYWGASRYWVGGNSGYLLKPNSGNISQIFQDTITQIGAGWAGTDDERGIKAAWWHLWNGDIRYSGASGCYRKDAGLATLIISDEDERSIGGDISQQYYAGEYKVLENDDLPQTYVNYVKEVFGNNKRFATNSIIVRPGDSTCMASQDAAGSKSHYGTKYNELSLLTGGGVGSICDNDYTNNLKYFKDQIVKEMASLPLECNPVGNVNVSFTNGFTAVTRVENGVLFFNPKVPVGVTIRADYKCAL